MSKKAPKKTSVRRPVPRGASGRGADAPGASAATERAAAARNSASLALLIGVLAVLAAARALLAFVPAMWVWSLNLQRFLDPMIAWGPWVVLALALVPAVTTRLAPLGNGIGDAIARHPLATGVVAALLAASLVWAMPDRVRFVGDFLLRQGTVEVAERPAQLFPQALPLDVLLHYQLPRWIADTALLDANGASRLLGMIEAGALAALAGILPRAMGLGAGAALATAAVVFFGGYLGMFTGFSKAFAEMSVLAAAVGIFGLRVLRQGNGVLPLGVALAIGLALHRSALGFIPAVAFAWTIWLTAHGKGGAWKRPAILIALAVPLIALAVMLPRIVAVIRRWDALHFSPQAAGQQGDVLTAAFAGARPTDLVNLLLLLSPLLVAVPVLLPSWWRRRPPGAGRELGLLLLLAAPFLVVMPFLHPAQGLFRDWDDFAATGVTCSLLAAWAVGQTLRAAPRHGLAVAVTLAVAMPAFQWLAHHTDVDRGFARVRAFVLEPPARSPRERGTTWDFLGIRNFRLDRFDDAANAFAQAAETSPSPRILQEWALAETMRRNYRQAQLVYHRMLDKAPENPLGWLGLSTVSLHLGDVAEARRAANQLLALQPGNPDALRVLSEADQIERMLRGAAPPGATR